MDNASDFLSTQGINPLGAGISLVALLTLDLLGNSALIVLLYLHLQRVKERELNPGSTFQLLLSVVVMEFAYSVTVEGLTAMCYLNPSFDLTMSRGLCLLQAWASLTLTISSYWTMTLLALERLLSGTKPVSPQRQKRRCDRLLYTCYTGFIVSALVAVVPVSREGTVRAFDPSHSFCHFNYNLSDDAIMMTFCICLAILTFVLFQVQVYSFMSLLYEERQTNKAVKNTRKLDSGEQNTSANENLAIYHEYWLYRRKVRWTFAGKRDWNLTVTVLSLMGWLWICMVLFTVTFIKSLSGGEVAPRTSFVAVRMLSIHNAINPFLVIFIFAPFRQRALHYFTCGRIEYSRDDFILSKHIDHHVTKNSEPNWWRVIESSPWDAYTPTAKHKEGKYVYENDVSDEVDSYHESEYESNASRNYEGSRHGHSAPSAPSSVFYLNEDGKADVSNDYLLAVPVNRPGAGNGEIVERIFILHESQKNGDYGNDSMKCSPELIGEDVSHSPKLKQVVQSAKFKEMLNRNRRDPKDNSPRLFKVFPSDSLSQRNYGAKEISDDQMVVAGRNQATSFIESVQMTPKLKDIVESPAFQENALRSDSFVIDSESSSSSTEHVKLTEPTFDLRKKQVSLTSTPKLKRTLKSQNLRKCVLQKQEGTGSPKFYKSSNKPHHLTVVESASKQNGIVAKTNSKKSVLYHNDIELIQLSDESATSVERQINTPKTRRKRDKPSQRNHLERIKNKNVGNKYSHSFPKETALLQDVGTKPLQVLGLSPKYKKSKHEENGLFSKGDDRPEVLNALFQKALLTGSSTSIIDKDELVKTTGNGDSSRFPKGSLKKPRNVAIVRCNSDHSANDLGGEILIDGNYTKTFSELTLAKKNKENVLNPVKNGRVTFLLDQNRQENLHKVKRDGKITSERIDNPPSIEDAEVFAINEDKRPREINKTTSVVEFSKKQENKESKGDDQKQYQDRNESEDNAAEGKDLNANAVKPSQEDLQSNLSEDKVSQENIAQFVATEEPPREDGYSLGKDVRIGNGCGHEEARDRNAKWDMCTGNRGSQVTIPAIVVVRDKDPRKDVRLGEGDACENNGFKTMVNDSHFNNGDNHENKAENNIDLKRTMKTLNGESMPKGNGIVSHEVKVSTDNGLESSRSVNDQRQGSKSANLVTSSGENSPIGHQVDLFVESVLQNILTEHGAN